MNKICVVHQSLGGGLSGAVLAAADHHLPPKIASKDHLEAAAKWQKCRFPIANMQSRSNGNCRQRPHNQLVSIIFSISKTSLVDKYLDEPQTPTPHFDNILMDSNPQTATSQFDLFPVPASCLILPHHLLAASPPCQTPLATTRNENTAALHFIAL